jgi:hypothetical protein
MTCFCDDNDEHITNIIVFSPWKPEFSPRAVNVGYMVDRMALSQVFLPGIILPFLHSLVPYLRLL